MADHLTLTNMVELANHLSESLTAHYRDIGDIDFVIEELNRKKKAIARRMERDAAHLRKIINDKYFNDNVTASVIADLSDALDGVDELVEIQMCNISE